MSEYFGIILKNLKPISTNHYKKINFKTKRVFKPKETTGVFQQRVMIECIKHRPQIFSFETNYSIYENCLSCTVVISVPIGKLITKKGVISKSSIDLDNCCKILIDSVFNAFEKLDDKMITSLNVSKIESEDQNFNIFFGLTRLNREDILKDEARHP